MFNVIFEIFLRACFTILHGPLYWLNLKFSELIIIIKISLFFHYFVYPFENRIHWNTIIFLKLSVLSVHFLSTHFSIACALVILYVYFKWCTQFYKLLKIIYFLCHYYLMKKRKNFTQIIFKHLFFIIQYRKSDVFNL